MRYKKIAVDCDDVLAYTFPILLFLLNKRFGKDFKISDVLAYNLADLFGVEGADIADAYMDFDKRGIFFQLPVFAGAVDGLRALKERGNEIHVVSSRPEYMRKHTSDYLKKYFDGLIKELHLAEHPSDLKSGEGLSKAEIVKDIKADVLVDDCLEHILEAYQVGAGGILFDYRGMYGWNKGDLPEGVKRVHGWREVVREIDRMS